MNPNNVTKVLQKCYKNNKLTDGCMVTRWLICDVKNIKQLITQSNTGIHRGTQSLFNSLLNPSQLIFSYLGLSKKRYV